MVNPLASGAGGFFSGLSDAMDQGQKQDDTWAKQSLSAFQENYKHYQKLQDDYNQQQNQTSAIAGTIGYDENDPIDKKAASDVANSWVTTGMGDKSNLNDNLPMLQIAKKHHKAALQLALQQVAKAKLQSQQQAQQQPVDSSDDTQGQDDSNQQDPNQQPNAALPDGINSSTPNPDVNSASYFNSQPDIDPKTAKIQQKLAKMYNMPVSEIVKISSGDYGDDFKQDSANLSGVDWGKLKNEQALDKSNNKLGIGSSFIDPETGDISNGSGGFGFQTGNIPPKVFNAMANEDSKRKQAQNANQPIITNIKGILNELEPNLKNVTTGKGASVGLGLAQLANTASFGGMFPDTASSAGNIDKGTNALATELNKFQYTPGMRGSVLGLQTILGSKPGKEQPNQTNYNIVNDIRSKLADYELSNELFDSYRDRSPLKLVDGNAKKLDDALKSMYPLETTDAKGNTVFNPDNAQKISDSIDDAIANPKKYLGKTKHYVTSNTGSNNGSVDNTGSTDATNSSTNTGSTISMDTVLESAKRNNIKDIPAYIKFLNSKKINIQDNSNNGT